MDQINRWLAVPSQTRLYMDSLLETVVLDDMRHPAYRRFKELYEPLGLRSEERAQRYRKVRIADATGIHQATMPLDPCDPHLTCMCACLQTYLEAYKHLRHASP